MRASALPADPPIKRRNGRYICALEGCRKTLPELAVTNNDPFCSTGCCHTWHRLELNLDPLEEERV